MLKEQYITVVHEDKNREGFEHSSRMCVCVYVCVCVCVRVRAHKHELEHTQSVVYVYLWVFSPCVSMFKVN